MTLTIREKESILFKYLNAKIKTDILMKRDKNSFKETIKSDEKRILTNKYSKKNIMGNDCLGKFPFKYIKQKYKTQ